MLAILCGCATSHGSPIVELSTGCVAACQQAAVAVYPDGFVERRDWVGGSEVRRTAALSPTQLRELDAVFERHRWSTIDRGALDCPETDLGTLYSISYRGELLTFFDQCPGVPADVLLLARELGSLLGVEP